MFDSSAANESYLTVFDAAKRLGLSPDTVRRMIARREIGFLRLGSRRGRLVLNESHLNEYLSRRTSQPIAA
jgi:excisionase family DNA binding protein